MAQRRNPLLIVAPMVTLACMILSASCSRQVPFENLRQENGRYYLGAGSRPFSGNAVSFFENGRKKAEYRIAAGKFHGRVTTWYRDGSRKSEMDYRLGREHGVATAWFPGGGKQHAYEYRNGFRDGLSISWDEKGRMRSQASFREGKLDGRWTLWHADGKKQEENEYRSDRKHGLSIQWYANGQKKVQAVLDQGEYHGAVDSWYENGKKESQKFFKHGQPDSLWRWWHANGNPEMRIGFKDGEYDGAIAAWYENGNKKFSRFARRGQPVHIWESWYPAGSRRTSGQWQNGKLHGQWLEWESNGNKREEITYQEGKKISVFQWYADGRRKLAASWRDEDRSWHWRFWGPDGTESTEKGRPIFKGLFPEFFSKTVPFPHALTSARQRALNSLKKIHDFPVYSMEYSGEYGLNSFLANGGAGAGYDWSELSVRQKKDFCSSFMARDPRGHVIFAHNWDSKQTPLLILFTRPSDGYASISVVSILGMNDISANLDLARFRDSATYLRAPYYPMEGMNARGLAIGCMYVPGEAVEDPRRTTVTMCQLIRLVLDYAANLDEAVALIESYNNKDSQRQHFLVADASGRSAVIEYQAGGLAVLHNREPWQVATNTLIAGVSEESLRRECWRYDVASRLLEQKKGRLSMKLAMDVMNKISMTETPETILSSVYNLNSGELHLVVGRDFKNVLTFRLQR